MSASAADTSGKSRRNLFVLLPLVLSTSPPRAICVLIRAVGTTVAVCVAAAIIVSLNVFLQSHHQQMPSLRLDRDEMNAVIDYILSLKVSRRH